MLLPSVIAPVKWFACSLDSRVRALTHAVLCIAGARVRELTHAVLCIAWARVWELTHAVLCLARVTVREPTHAVLCLARVTVWELTHEVLCLARITVCEPTHAVLCLARVTVSYSKCLISDETLPYWVISVQVCTNVPNGVTVRYQPCRDHHCPYYKYSWLGTLISVTSWPAHLGDCLPSVQQGGS